MGGGLTRRAVVASGLLLIVIAGAFVALLVQIVELRDSTQERRATRQQLIAADDLEKLVLDLETGLRGFVITGEERFLEPWNSARTDFPEQAGVLRRLASGDPVQRARVEEIVRGGESYIRVYAEPLIAAVRRNDASARSVARTAAGKRRIDELRADFDVFTATARAALAAREESAEAAGRRAVVAGVVALAGPSSSSFSSRAIWRGRSCVPSAGRPAWPTASQAATSAPGCRRERPARSACSRGRSTRWQPRSRPIRASCVGSWSSNPRCGGSRRSWPGVCRPPRCSTSSPGRSACSPAPTSRAWSATRRTAP